MDDNADEVPLQHELHEDGEVEEAPPEEAFTTEEALQHNLIKLFFECEQAGEGEKPCTSCFLANSHSKLFRPNSLKSRYSTVHHQNVFCARIGFLASQFITSTRKLTIQITKTFYSVSKYHLDCSGGLQVVNVAIDKLIEVLSEENRSSTWIVLLKDVEKTFTGTKESYACLTSELPPGVLIIGSHTLTASQKDKFLIRHGIKCNNVEELLIKDQLLTDDNVDKIAGYGLSYHVRDNKPNVSSDAKVVLLSERLKHGLSTVGGTHSGSSKNELKRVSLREKFLSNVIRPMDIGVTFVNSGVLENVKDTLNELVMVPLQRLELFSKAELTKPLKGTLLFGLPGTGNTMLAKAVATEAGANFNTSMSCIWFREVHKYAKAIFSLASKISPAVIFVDEVDSMLGRRENPGEHEAICKMKNEFMVNWDGLLMGYREHGDLNDAIVRWLSRRFMLNLTDASKRERILILILSKDILALDMDLESLASMTDGYSGCDFKNLCVTAEHLPIREITEKEKTEKSFARAEGRSEPPLRGRSVHSPSENG